MAANLRLGSKGFLLNVCIFPETITGLFEYFIIYFIGFQRIFERFYDLISELNLELLIDAKLARLSGCSFGLLKMRYTLAPLPQVGL